MVNSNIAIGSSLPTLQISVGIFVLFEKIYDDELIVTLIVTVVSPREEVPYNTVVANKCLM
jgi:hypothetical protein